MTPGRLCHRWSGKLMINWTSFSAGPSDSAIRRASSGVRRFISSPPYISLFYLLKAENPFRFPAEHSIGQEAGIRTRTVRFTGGDAAVTPQSWKWYSHVDLHHEPPPSQSGVQN